jgi:hypothetical protein
VLQRLRAGWLKPRAAQALRNRSVASHELNRDSSRSHAILTIHVDAMVTGDGGHIATHHGKISFVDLAGSERLKDSHSQGQTLRETGAINKSIFTLGKVAPLLNSRVARAPGPRCSGVLHFVECDCCQSTDISGPPC